MSVLGHQTSISDALKAKRMYNSIIDAITEDNNGLQLSPFDQTALLLLLMTICLRLFTL